jgi:hypothetical protein
MLRPRERAEAARRRVLDAADRVPAEFHGYLERRPVSVLAFALAGGFVIGYWPRANRLLVKNLGGVLRFLCSLKL